MPEIDRIIGMQNTVDPVRAELGTLAASKNVDIDDTYSAVRRPGQTAFGSFGAISSAYATRDMRNLYVLDTGILKSVSPDGTATALANGLRTGEMWWAEAGNYVFCNGANKGMILNGVYSEWGVTTASQVSVTVFPGEMPAGRYLFAAVYRDADGRQGGCREPLLVITTEPSSFQLEIKMMGYPQVDFYVSTMDGDQLYYYASASDGVVTVNSPQEALAQPLSEEYIGAMPPPYGEQIAFFDGRMYVANSIREHDVTHIFMSDPLSFHLFNYATGYISVPGEVRVLVAVEGALIIGTDREIFAYNGESITTLADYGVAAGQACAPDESGKVFLWTDRGLCRALPFENLTEKKYSFEPGDRAVVQFMQHNGYAKAVVVARNGGSAFNKYESG